MYGQLLNRSGLTDLLAGKRAAGSQLRELFSADDLQGAIAKEQVVAVWPERDAAGLPCALLVDEEAQRDWTAWVVTYVPLIRPFTAYCRIVGLDAGRRFLFPRENVGLGAFESGYLGLILGEVISWDERNVVVRRAGPIPSACMSTLSFALSRFRAVYGSAEGLRRLAGRWSDVQQLTRQRGRSPISPDRVVQIVEILADAQDRSDAPSRLPVPMAGIASLCARLARGEVPGINELISLVESPLAQLFGFMEGTREERVALVERAMDIVQKYDRSDESDCFALGFLASRIAPGMLAHASVLTRILPVCPTAVLWYAICTGLCLDSKLQNEFSGVGRRVLRELCVSELGKGRPSADIGWMELEIFLGSQRPPLEDFVVGSPSVMSVELTPGVSTTVTWTPGRSMKAEPAAPVQPQQYVVREERYRDEHLAREMEATLERLTSIWTQLSSERYRRSRPDQQQLFEPAEDKSKLPQPDKSPARRGRRRD